MEKVAIILVNWNGYLDTFNCLKSLEKINYDIENITSYLVDNNSTDDSFYRLKQEYQKNTFKINVEFIGSGENLGFAGGNNLGIKKAYKDGFKYFWLLNNDTEVEPNALKSLMVVLQSSESIGIVGSKIYYFSKPNTIWFAGGEINMLTGETKHVGYNEVDNGQFSRQIESGYITGCSLGFKAQLLEQIGYMSEDYFLYYEETDWNIRAKNAGWKIIFCPESIVYHKVSSSSGGISNIAPYVEYYKIRNRYVMAQRNFKQLSNKFFVSFCFTILKKLVKILLFNNKKIIRLKYLFRAVIDGKNKNMGMYS